MIRRSIAIAVALVATLSWAPAEAQAQSYPSRPVTVIVPYPAGGSTDVMMRLIAQKFLESTGQSVIIENRAGGGGAVGVVAVRQAAPDGYTLLMSNQPIFAINPALSPNLPFDPVKDFKPVSPLYTLVQGAFVPASSPATTLAELVELARKKPGGLSYASQGNGAGGHIIGALLARMTGAPMVHIPYKGAAPGVTDLAAGRVDLFFTTFASAGPQLKAGKLRVLAVVSKQRLRFMPDLVTTVEAGFPGLELEPWFGLFAPVGTPDSIVARANEEFGKVVRHPDIVKRFTAEGLQPANSTPRQFGAVLAADLVLYAKVIKDLGIRAD